MAPDKIDFTTCTARLAWCELAVRDLNELSRQHALTVGDASISPEGDTSLLMGGAILASNAVHQLRSTLDNLVRLLVVWNGETPSRVNAFPIVEVDNANGRKTFKRRLANVNSAHVAIIDRCQPYHDPNGHPLLLLETLWNTDKHHVLGLIGAEEAVLPFAGVEVQSFRWTYSDGTWVIPGLRRALAYVMQIVEGFAVLLETGIDTHFPIYEVVMAQAELLQSQDPSATYQDDLLEIRSRLTGPDGAKARKLKDFPRNELVAVLAVCDRLLDGPVAELHRYWLEQLQAKVLEAINANR